MNRGKRSRKAFDRGLADFWAGRKATRNPYQAARYRKLWMLGFYEAQMSGRRPPAKSGKFRIVREPRRVTLLGPERRYIPDRHKRVGGRYR